jgi:hypothetical protein
MCTIMNRRSARTWRRLIAALALAGAALGAAAADGPAAVGQPRHLGVASCASTLCHGSAKPTSAYAVSQNEYVVWSHFDPHARAYRVLLDERAAAIVRRMGLPPAYEAKVCLDCHTDNVVRDARGPRFQLSDGVGCESCHGASENWIASHDDTPKVTHADNLARGLVALEKPRVRAEVCLDCHVGNDNQLATHRMMAAGHPRLAFELDTFTELWRTSGGREHYRVDDDYRARKGTVSAAETWSAGLVAQIGRQLELVRGPQFNTGSVFPELALFNCYSCHRSMRLKRWQEKGGEFVPGSLRFDDGSLRMFEALIAARQPAALDALRDRIRGWQLAATHERSAVVSESEALAGLVRDLDRQVAGAAWSGSERRSALDYLVAGASRGSYPDYASAEQCAMSVVVLLADLGGRPKGERAIDELFSALSDDDRYDAGRFRLILGRLERHP